MDRYVVTAWARKVFLVFFCMVALMWGIRQATLIYQMWFTDQATTKKESTTDVSVVPESAKSIGKQFLLHYYDTKKDETQEQKSKRLADLVTNHMRGQWNRIPSLLLLNEEVAAENIVPWDDKWLEVGKKALIE